jgi:putative NIF3 family GTP cyclohydrolase 1 type 2
LTGDIGHHHALEAKTLGLALIDGGHFQTEQTALKIFAERMGSFLQKQNLDVQVYFEDSEKDPTRYF